MTNKIKKIIISGTIIITLLSGGKIIIDYQDELSRVSLEQKLINQEVLTFEEFYMTVKPDGIVNKEINKFRNQDGKIRIQNFNSKKDIYKVLKSKK